MATNKQVLGKVGELLVITHCSCPKCKKNNTLKCLPPNFKCADIICDFCGYLAQVKSIASDDINDLPKRILGSAWGVQKDRLDSCIYIPLFIVLYKSKTEFGIYYLSADLQTPDMYIPRKPLSENAKRAGWQGFMYDLTKLNENSIVRIR